MLLLYVTAFCVSFGSSAGIQYEEVCYGRHLNLPFEYRPPIYQGPLYFTPNNGGSRKILMEDGEAKDPRIKISSSSVRLTDLTERDEGTFSVAFGDDRLYDIIVLTVLDCPNAEITQKYGATYYFTVPRETEFLEFTPLGSLEQPEVLWNRTNPQTSKGGRGQMKRFSWQLVKLTQADSGYYNFRKKNTLLSRIHLTVQENSRHYDAKVDERLFIQYPPGTAPWTVTFTPEGEMEQQTLVKVGKLITEDDWMVEASHHFTGRILVAHNGIEIDPVESTDSGTFEFRDSQGNLAQTVHVEVKHEIATVVYVGIIVGIVFALIACCCCVRKCCCKKSSSKRDQPAAQSAAVYYHDENQPAGPTYSAPAHSYQPANSLVLREPTTTSLGSSVYDPVNIHVNPLQPEVAPLGGQGAPQVPSIGSDCLSSDPEPTFELKGLTFPSGPPLSSDSTFSDVYTSDKLNFL